MNVRRFVSSIPRALGIAAAVAATAAVMPAAEAHGGGRPRVGISVRVGPPAPVWHRPHYSYHAFPRYRYWAPGVVVAPGIAYGAAA